MNLPQLKLLKLNLVYWPLPLQPKHVKAFVLVFHNARPPLLVCQPYALSIVQQNTTTAEGMSAEAIVPSLCVLQSNSRIQDHVDQILRQLTELNEAGKLKSQRGGNETVFIEKNNVATKFCFRGSK